MAKIFKHYENNLEKAWYDSSNILYSECDDKDNDLKTLRITFKNGRTYEYYNINVNDYLLFREDPSQGKAFNRLIKQYTCERIGDRNLEEINSELERLRSLTDDWAIDWNEEDTLKLLNNGNVFTTFNTPEGKINKDDFLEIARKIKLQII